MLARTVTSYLVIAFLQGCTGAQDGPVSVEDAAASLELADAVVLSAPAAPLAVDGGALLVHPAQAHTTLGFLGVPVFAGNGWALGTSTNAVVYPVQVAVGDVVTGANLYVQRSNPAATLVAQLQRVDNATGLRLPLSASVLENSGTTGSVVVPLPALTSEPLDGAYTVAITVAGLGVDGIVVGNAVVARQLAPPTAAGSERWSAVQRGATERFISYDGGDFFHTTANDAFVTQPITNVAVGERFSSASFRMKGTGGVQTVQAHLIRGDGNGSSTILHTVYAQNPPATWQTFTATWTPGPDDVVTAGKAYYWYFVLPLAGTFVAHNGFTTAP